MTIFDYNLAIPEQKIYEVSFTFIELDNMRGGDRELFEKLAEMGWPVIWNLQTQCIEPPVGGTFNWKYYQAGANTKTFYLKLAEPEPKRLAQSTDYQQLVSFPYRPEPSSYESFTADLVPEKKKLSVKRIDTKRNIRLEDDE